MNFLPKSKYGLEFKLVRDEDASFILSLRTDVNLSKFLSKVDNDLNRQRIWIFEYLEREKEGKEYYIIAFKEGKRVGLVRLYNFINKTFTSGSWIMAPGSDEETTFKVDLFVMEFAFQELGFDTCIIEVKENNIKVLRYHKLFFSEIERINGNCYLKMDKLGYERKKNYLTRILNVFNYE